MATLTSDEPQKCYKVRALGVDWTSSMTVSDHFNHIYSADAKVHSLPIRGSVENGRLLLSRLTDYIDYMEHAFPDGTVVGQVFSNACKNPPLSILDNTTIHFAFTGGLSIHPDCSTMEELAILAKRRLGLQQPPISPEEEQDVVVSALCYKVQPH